jgi:glycosyltransferase involved in cell wall biosynthesis
MPAHKAEEWIAESIRSAVAQTWQRKEIIVVNDGSTGRTGEVARSFAAENVKVVSTENRGLSGAVNTAYRLCQGDYIRELDADEVLAPDKIERQLTALRETDGPRTLLSGPRGYFYYSTKRARPALSLRTVSWFLKGGCVMRSSNATLSCLPSTRSVSSYERGYARQGASACCL